MGTEGFEPPSIGFFFCSRFFKKLELEPIILAELYYVPSKLKLSKSLFKIIFAKSYKLKLLLAELMRNYYEDRKERYKILKASTVYYVQSNLLFKSSITPKFYQKEREKILELVRVDCEKSFRLALAMLKAKYKHCPAKGPLEAILKEYY